MSIRDLPISIYNKPRQKTISLPYAQPDPIFDKDELADKNSSCKRDLETDQIVNLVVDNTSFAKLILRNLNRYHTNTESILPRIQTSTHVHITTYWYTYVRPDKYTY